MRHCVAVEQTPPPSHMGAELPHRAGFKGGDRGPKPFIFYFSLMIDYDLVVAHC